MSVPEQHMDKLISLTLVNWYLIGANTIDLSGDVTLIRGQNGSGKSSILDAIQTVLAGGDENELLMNAASSDGKRSARNIRSYALGVVTEADGQLKCEPRKESNTYLCMTFSKKDGAIYNAGIAIHATAGQQQISKKLFLYNGEALTTTDFMLSENQVMTWRQFEQQLKDSEGLLALPTTAQEFRYRLAESMSAPGPGHQISPQMMLRTLKKAISFKEQKCISTFVKEHILPAQTIDVVKIQNDYSQYESIEKLILEAQERVTGLKEITRHYARYCSENKRSAGYQWVALEASVIGVDEELTAKREEAEDKRLDLAKDQGRKEIVEGEIPDAQRARDEALNALNNSAYKQTKKAAEEQVSAFEAEIAEESRTIREARATIESVLSLSIPDSMSSVVAEAITAAQAKLKKVAAIDDTDLVQQWPQSKEHTAEILQCVEELRLLKGKVQSERDRARSSVEALENKLKERKTIHRALEQGDAKLMSSTEDVIALLARHDIKAIPVCDLATVSDESWQTGIERFLGGNREALVVESSDYDEAVRCYRKAKDTDSRLRRVKLVKPDRQFGFHGNPERGAAAALIESDNAIARGYLRGLLRNVNLVETEEELRRENRAITRDGMVAGNGAISGGNQFNYNLLGQNARRSSAQQILLEIEMLVEQIKDVRGVFDPIDLLNTKYDQLTRSAGERGALVNDAMVAATRAVLARNQAQQKLGELEGNPDTALEMAFTKANEKYVQLNEEKGTLLVSVTQLTNTLNELDAKIPSLEQKRKGFEDQRKQKEKLIGNDMGYAQDLYDDIEAAFEDPIFEDIKSRAEVKSAEAANNAESAKERGVRQLTTFLTTHEPEDRKEIQAMDEANDEQGILDRCNEHIDRIENAEMLGYEDDAREARHKMLQNFRSEVVNNLNGNIKSLEQTFKTLNSQLTDLTFNNNQYRFKYTLVEAETMKTVHDYVMNVSEDSAQDVGGLFDTDQENPAVKIIEEVLLDGRLDDISDYRNFFTYDIAVTDKVADSTRLFSDLLGSGSGGEKQTPFYVALGASFMSAYKIRKIGSSVFGGAALAIFDEAFSKMDGNNAQTALNFFREIGLQVILAAPPESEVKIGPYADMVYNILRTGQHVYIDRKHYTEQGSALLESDNPQLHAELVEPYIAALEEEDLVE